MAGNEDWKRKNADTHKMSPEEISKAGLEASKRPPGHKPGEILHQRRSLPFSPLTVILVGSALVGTMWYFTLYAKKKPEASAVDVARVSTGLANPEETHPRK
ncbi:hypothetical protein CDL12_14943 [Handroanthus impetiginosus]|uniref:Transmembrane protein n=1 Tax=Handroanthus impetiginosus TaxID=429701 RepID=A0A2G9H4L1_9LAMI|nr:hypothetical protein CDL12_14943 [Handroanthus impetiginosus]